MAEKREGMIFVCKAMPLYFIIVADYISRIFTYERQRYTGFLQESKDLLWHFNLKSGLMYVSDEKMYEFYLPDTEVGKAARRLFEMILLELQVQLGLMISQVQSVQTERKTGMAEKDHQRKSECRSAKPRIGKCKWVKDGNACDSCPYDSTCLRLSYCRDVGNSDDCKSCPLESL